MINARQNLLTNYQRIPTEDEISRYYFNDQQKSRSGNTGCGYSLRHLWKREQLCYYCAKIVFHGFEAHFMLYMAVRKESIIYFNAINRIWIVSSKLEKFQICITMTY